MERVKILALSVLFLSLIFACETTPEESVEAQVEDDPIEEPVEVQPETTDIDTTEDFSVTEDVYQETFIDIDEIINQLNNVILSRDIDTWKTYLTEEYIVTYSDPTILKEYSQRAILRNNNIELKSIDDYFTFVVAPSRSNVRLDELVFLEETVVEAIMIIGTQKVTVYRLKLIDGDWKISDF